MVEVKIDDKEYTEEMYKRDLARMFDSARKYCDAHPGRGDCEDCIFANGEECNYFNNIDSLKNVMRVYKWAKDHSEEKEREGKQND